MSELKEWRIFRKMSQRELSEESGVNLRMIQYYEQGVKDINKAEALTVYKLAKALRLHVEDILEIKKEVEE